MIVKENIHWWFIMKDQIISNELEFLELMISIEPKLMSLEYLLKIASDKKSDTIYSMSSTAAA